MMKIAGKISALRRYLQGLSGDNKTSLMILILGIISLIVFVMFTISTGIIPFYILVIILTVVGVIYEILYFLMFNHKTRRIIVIISNITFCIVAILLMITAFYINATANLFKKIQVDDTEIIEYSVLVRKNESKFKGLGNIGAQTIGFYKDDNTRKAKEYLKPEIIRKAGGDFGIKMIEESSLYDLAKQFLNGEDRLGVICLSQAQIQILSDKIEGFTEQVRDISNFYLDVPTYRAGIENEINYNESFALYLSVVNRFDLMNNLNQVEKPHEEYDHNLKKFKPDLSIDTYGYSEINQLIIVNPKTSKILIINIPEDYYMESDEENMNGDTLADTGLIGVQRGIDSLDRLFEIRIKYYLKTTFDGLESLANELGIKNVGLDTDEEKQKILDEISDKMTTTDILWRNYSPILTAMSNAFQTNMPVGLMTNLLNRQIAIHPKWQVEEYNVDGDIEEKPLDILGNDEEKSQVLIPDENSIETAKEKIQSVLNEE